MSGAGATSSLDGAHLNQKIVSSSYHYSTANIIINPIATMKLFSLLALLVTSSVYAWEVPFVLRGSAAVSPCHVRTLIVKSH